VTIAGVDLRLTLGPVRDQGSRPTCLAFAASDAHRAACALPEQLSADYAHHHAARRLNATMNEPVSTEAMCQAIESDGQPTEAKCAYSDPRGDDWKPPADVGPVWKRRPTVANGKSASALLRRALASSCTNVLTLLVSESFFSPDPVTHVVADDASPDVGEHAVVVVGIREGGEFYLVRNSWGPAWGAEGHAWLPRSYVDARAINIVQFLQGSRHEAHLR
jgi:C1A family cysteine protease